jgi:hypothetical protein
MLSMEKWQHNQQILHLREQLRLINREIYFKEQEEIRRIARLNHFNQSSKNEQ